MEDMNLKRDRDGRHGSKEIQVWKAWVQRDSRMEDMDLKRYSDGRHGYKERQRWKTRV